MNTSYLDSFERRRLRHLEHTMKLKIIFVRTVEFGFSFYAKDLRDRGRLKKFKFLKNKLVRV